MRRQRLHTANIQPLPVQILSLLGESEERAHRVRAGA